MEKSIENTLEYIRCIICLEMEMNPMECDNCGVIVCGNCI